MVPRERDLQLFVRGKNPNDWCSSPCKAKACTIDVLPEVDMKKMGSLRARLSVLVSLSVLVLPIAGLEQRRVVAPKNPYRDGKDVELGRPAAQQAYRQFPLLNDQGAQDYVERVGRRLVEAI